MKPRTGATIALAFMAVGVSAVLWMPFTPLGTGVIVLVGTVLPAMTAYNGWRRSKSETGREATSYRLLSVAMTMYTPVYLLEYLGAVGLERALVVLTYTIGGLALFVIPQPDIGKHHRLVAVFDSIEFGLLVATLTFWAVWGSNLGVGAQTLYVVVDAAIMAVAGYVAVRRSTPTADWAMITLVLGMGVHVAATTIRLLSVEPYRIGHVSDIAYLTGVGVFAIATNLHANSPNRQVVAPLRWGRVLAPYLFVVILSVLAVADIVEEFGQDPSGSVVEASVMLMLIVMLLRQLAMIADQRHKIELDRAGVVSTVSHELRTPLTAMVGYLDLLEDWDHFSEKDRQEMLTTVREQSHVMARVVGDLVDVARDRIESMPLEKRAVDAATLVDRCVNSVTALSRMSVQTEVPAGYELHVDRDRMGQVIINLLSNAARYGDQKVLVRVRRQGGNSVIEVHDDGPGVPDTYRLVIWERFERGAYRQSAVPGSGIGLAVARGIARAHGGTTGYRPSDRLGGACFSVSVPDAHPRRRTA